MCTIAPSRRTATRDSDCRRTETVCDAVRPVPPATNHYCRCCRPSPTAVQGPGCAGAPWAAKREASSRHWARATSAQTSRPMTCPASPLEHRIVQEDGGCPQSHSQCMAHTSSSLWMTTTPQRRSLPSTGIACTATAAHDLCGQLCS